MHYLIAESVALKPHLETAGELALKLRDDGHEVTFAWLGDRLPWSDWQLPVVARMVGCSLDRRVRRFMQLLSSERVAVTKGLPEDKDRLARALAWAGNFSGDTEALKGYRLESAGLGMGAASSLISLHGDSHYAAELHLKEVRQCLASSAVVYERAHAAIAALKPDVVVTFNGRFATSKPIVAAAEAFDLPVLRHERGSTFQRYEVFDDALHNYAYIRRRIQEYWAATAPQTREQNGHEFFRRRRGGDGIGWYSFTAQQERGSIPEKNAAIRRVVYFSSSDDEYAAVTDVFEPGPWPNQLAAVKALIEALADSPNTELVLRIHPHLSKKSEGERARWQGLKGRNLKVIGAGETVDSYALLDSADVVVSYGSTIGMEAAYWGKPSILLGPCSYTDSPAVLSPKNDAELKLLLHDGRELHPAPQAACLAYGHYYLSYGTPFKYYKPTSLSDGKFLGERLGWDPEPIFWLRRQGAGRAYRNLMSRWKRRMS